MAYVQMACICGGTERIVWSVYCDTNKCLVSVALLCYIVHMYCASVCACVSVACMCLCLYVDGEHCEWEFVAEELRDAEIACLKGCGEHDSMMMVELKWENISLQQSITWSAESRHRIQGCLNSMVCKPQTNTRLPLSRCIRCVTQSIQVKKKKYAIPKPWVFSWMVTIDSSDFDNMFADCKKFGLSFKHVEKCHLAFISMHHDGYMLL